MADHVWTLRSERSFAVIHCALRDARDRTDVRSLMASLGLLA